MREHYHFGGDDDVEPPLAGATQWQVISPGHFAAAHKSVPVLPSGVYKVENDHTHGIVMVHTELRTDTLVELHGMVSQAVVDDIRRFWCCRAGYDALGQVYKRGVLLYGLPGVGKTSTINLLAREVVSMGGIVLLNERPKYAAAAMQLIRSLDKERPIIHVIEDIDVLLKVTDDEKLLLSMLDGADQIDNVVHLATTNYPEELEERVLKRPGRFDLLVEISIPDARTRKSYLEHLVHNLPGAKPDLDGWIRDTEGLTLSHLRELASSVLLMNQPYGAVLERLRAMSAEKSGPRVERARGRAGFRKSMRE